MSTTTQPAPSGVVLPVPRRWTCVEFHQFGDLGLFEGRRAMLLDGVILEYGAMNPPHAITLGLVQSALQLAFGPGWWVRSQLPLVLGLHTDPEPDLAVVRGGPRQWTTHPTTAELVVEVADSSLRFDTTDKVGLYASAGLVEYWVVDVNSRRLLVHRDPQPSTGTVHGHQYADVRQLGPTDAVSPLATPTAAIAVADLLM